MHIPLFEIAIVTIWESRHAQEFFPSGPYSSFRLKARLRRQNNKNLRNFCATIDMIVVIKR